MRISLPENMPVGLLITKDGKSIEEPIGEQSGGD